jgi:flagellar hook-associated protein 2
MSTFSVGGLASGLDTKSIVDQLMQLEGRSRTKLEWKSQLWNARKSAWSDLNSRLLAVQNSANALLKPETWDVNSVASGTGAWGTTSGDPARLTATVGAAPAAGTYGIDVLQLARGEISRSTGALSAATAGRRTSGVFYEGNNDVVEGDELITGLRQQNGTDNTGLNTDSRITMNYAVNGVNQSAEFRVNTVANGGNGTTLTDLRDWVQTTIGNGATAEWVGGRLEVTTAPGTASALTAMSFTAVDASNTSLPDFDSLAGASSVQAVAATNGGVSANDTLTITNGSGSWNVAIAAGDDKQAIVNKINATSGIGVLATLNAGEVELRSTTMGTASAFTVTSAGSLAAALGFSETQAAQNAHYTVNGTAYTSATNTNVTGAITDVTLNLSGTTNTTLTVAQSGGGTGTQQDQWVTATKAKVKAFADAYNATLELVHQKTQGESRVTNPKNLGEYLQGPMARDNGFSSVGFDLRRTMTESVDGLPTAASMLSQVGIKTTFSVGSGANNGKLTIDDAQLDAALRADPQSVQDVIGKIGAAPGIGSDDGIVRQISDQVSRLRVGGRVDIAMNGAGTQVKSIQDSIDRATDRLDRKKLYFEKMFTNLERTMGRMQSQGSWMSGQLAALNASQQ